MMNTTSLPIAATLLLCSCSPRMVPVQSSRTDSVRIVRQVEYRERLRDTVIRITLPAENREVIRRDSSRLETTAARSLARIEPDGSLFHTLENKPAPLPVAAQLRDTERILSSDSATVQQTAREIPVRMPLTRWQKLWIRTGQASTGVFLLLTLLAAVRKKRH